MKVCILQPAYSTDFNLCDKYFEDQMALLAQYNSSMDLIVLPYQRPYRKKKNICAEQKGLMRRMHKLFPFILKFR